MTAAQVFISYRRDDAAGYARAIAAELSERFGPQRVFMDVDDIAAGQGFAEVIERAVAEAGVLLVLIGRRWRGEREGAPARLDEPVDFVRREVAAALHRGLRVIPLLLDGAPMPSAAELPEELRPLAGLQALEVGNARFAGDIERLVAAIGLPAATRPAAWRRRALWLGAAGLVAALAGAAAWKRQWGRSPARPAVNGDWVAEVRYDWPNAQYRERLRLDGEAGELHGSVTFLGVARGLLEGRVDAQGVSFVTRSSEMDGAELVHHYRGHVAADEIRFVMQTEGGTTPHEPVSFVARRDGGPAGP
ncbi:toll/interleukin-1 receptor domain-containing protein [Ideonella sp.]|uniref:toll/interleukin-1 receptor domain-containing protein n=1 Tax=Ideonella sp. TaxID=1929293 RepID=UPI002B4625D5|nr:toll/interleukin-1 receptor domain-containing protein [Ideonella sp.]HJV68088.1 toll/interleukin-1 receptor domain-containing protein [Ideonella sp.]